MRGTSMSNTTCTNGSSTAVTTWARTGASRARASARSRSTISARAAPGGSDTDRARPSRSVNSRCSDSPAATLRYQTKFISRRPGSSAPSGPGIGYASTWLSGNTW
jgi:hypothetical protein